MMARPALYADTRVATSRANYEKRLKAIEARYGGKETNWPVQYTKQLQGLERTMQAAGNLDGLLDVRKELSRFSDTDKLTEDNLVEEPLLLRELQMKYADVTGDVALAKGRAILDLVGKYAAYMEDLKKELTIAGKLKGAVAARDEIE
ncbi:hypothetical protein ACFLQU_06090, partial [Verrucomicrobiota bacterium]